MRDPIKHMLVQHTPHIYTCDLTEAMENTLELITDLVQLEAPNPKPTLWNF